MKVIEGKQVAFVACREVGIQTPISVPTTSCPVIGMTDCPVVETANYSVTPTTECPPAPVADCLEIETKEYPAETLTPVSLHSVRPSEARTSSHLKELRMTNMHTKQPESLPDAALIPIHTESAKPNLIPVRNGQSEMTLEELFRIGRKEEEK